jgi:hypothetical protein
VAQFLVLCAKCPTPLNLVTPVSYYHKNHPPLISLVSPKRTNIKPMGLNIQVLGLISPPHCMISPFQPPTIITTTHLITPLVFPMRTMQ